MQLFKEIIKDRVFRLNMPVTMGAPITLVTIAGQNFLINCGSCEAAVADYLIPALKKNKLPISKINYLLLTDCHPESMGGAHKLKQCAPDIRIVVTSYQAKQIKNPMYHLLGRWKEFSDWAPPMRDMRGIIADNESVENDKEFDCIIPIPAMGHDDSCVCWSIPDDDVLICGSALQGKGTKTSGMACYNDLDAYLDTLDRIEYLGNSEKSEVDGVRFPKILLCNNGIDGIDGVTESEKECRGAIKICRKAVSDYNAFLQRYMRAHGLNSEMINYHDLVTEYFPKAERPEYLGYSMMTFKAHGAIKPNSNI